MVDNDDNESYSDIEDRNEEKSGDESDMDVEELREPDNSAYAIWKTNAQYLYDLLLHNHTSWPCSTCAWGPILNSEYLTPVSPLSQRIFLTTHTDGSFNSNTRRWTSSPECIVLASVEMTRRRGTQTWFIAKYNESQRNRNFVTIKHIVHPGGIGRLKVVPDTEWVVTHSTDSRLYFWNTKTQKNHSARDGTDASPADLCFTTCNGDKFTEYPLAIYSRKKATFVRKVEIPLLKGSKISAPEFYEPPKDVVRKSVKRLGSGKKGSKKVKTKKEEVVKEEDEEEDPKEEEDQKDEEEDPKEEEKEEEEKEEDQKEDEEEEDPKEEEKEEEEDQKEEKGEEDPKEEDPKEEDPKVEEDQKEEEEEDQEEEDQKEKDSPRETHEEKKESEVMKEESEEESDSQENIETKTEDESGIPKIENDEKHGETPNDGIEYRFLCVSKNNLHVWNLKDLSANNSSASILYELNNLLNEEGEDVTIEDICFLDGFDKNGTLIGIAGSHGFVGVYSLDKRELLWKNTTKHEGDVHCILNISTSQAYQREPYEGMEKLVLTCGVDKCIYVWNIEDCIRNPDQEPYFSLETTSSVLCIDYCPQIPRYIAVGTESGEIDLFDLLAKGAEEYLVLRHLGHRTAVSDLQFNPYELLTIVSCSDDSDIGGGGSIQIWRPHELLMVRVESNEEENEALEEIVSFVKK